MSEPGKSTTKLIAELWQRNQPVILARLAQLDAAAAAAHDGILPTAQREEAASTAHKLSGSVGMFGFKSATGVARDLEVELANPTPDPGRLTSLASALRSALYPGPSEE